MLLFAARFAIMRAPRWSLACSLALFFEGCAAIETSAVPPSMPLPGDFSSPAGTSALVGAELKPGWWRLLRDQKFDRLVETMLADNFALAEARSRLTAARLSYGAAGGEFRPQTRVIGALRQDNSETIYPIFGGVDLASTGGSGGVDATWELDYLGRADMERRSASASVENVEAAEATIRSGIVAEALRAYALLSIATEELKVLERAVESARQFHQLTEMRRGRGFASDVDVLHAEAVLTRYEARRPQLVAEIAGLRAGLGALSGRIEPFSDPASRVSLGAFRFASIPGHLIQQRPDVREAASNLLKAAAERDLAEADLYPRMRISGDLVIGRGLTGSIASTLAGALGPQLQIPLFDLDLRQARLSAKEQVLEAVAFAYRDRVVSAVAEVRRGLAQLGQSRAQIERREDERRIAAKADRMTDALFRGGSSGKPERLQSAISYGESELALFAARRQEVQALVFTLKSLGQPI